MSTKLPMAVMKKMMKVLIIVKDRKLNIIPCVDETFDFNTDMHYVRTAQAQ